MRKTDKLTSRLSESHLTEPYPNTDVSRAQSQARALRAVLTLSRHTITVLS